MDCPKRFDILSLEEFQENEQLVDVLEDLLESCKKKQVPEPETPPRKK